MFRRKARNKGTVDKNKNDEKQNKNHLPAY